MNKQTTTTKTSLACLMMKLELFQGRECYDMGSPCTTPVDPFPFLEEQTGHLRNRLARVYSCTGSSGHGGASPRGFVVQVPI